MTNGLRKGDLRNLVRPYCTIDRIQPKLDASNIVVQFYINRGNEDAAYDLSNFIEKGTWQDVIDTEVSEVPNKDGEYVVFMEVPRTVKFVEDFIELVKDINDLSELEENEWEFKILSNEDILPMTEKILKKVVDLSGVHIDESVMTIGNVDLNKSTTVINGSTYIFEEVDHECIGKVFDSYESNIMSQQLGEEYTVGMMASGKIIVETIETGRLVTLDKII